MTKKLLASLCGHGVCMYGNEAGLSALLGRMYHSSP